MMATECERCGAPVPPEWRCNACEYSALAAAEQRAARAESKAKQYERDWYDAKSGFGDAMARIQAERDAALAQRDALAAALREIEEDQCRACMAYALANSALASTPAAALARQQAIAALVEAARSVVVAYSGVPCPHVSTIRLADALAALDQLKK